jgi:hypothetical protein
VETPGRDQRADGRVEVAERCAFEPRRVAQQRRQRCRDDMRPAVAQRRVEVIHFARLPRIPARIHRRQSGPDFFARGGRRAGRQQQFGRRAEEDARFAPQRLCGRRQHDERGGAEHKRAAYCVHALQ